jgi:hypothetical protein
MTRKLSVLFVLAFFVVSVGSAAFAANAKTAGHSSPLTSAPQAAAKTMTPSDDAVGGTEAFGKPETTEPSALGYYMMSAVPVGTSPFDYQSNDRQQRHVVVGSDNRIHTVFMYRGMGQTAASSRTVRYNGFRVGTNPPAPTAGNISPGTGGYGSITIGPNDTLAIATYHYTKINADPEGPVFDARSRLAIGRQGGIFSTAFSMNDYPSPDTVMPNILNCQGIKTGLGTQEGGYIWPSIAGDVNGSGVTIAHVLAKESPSATSTDAYFDTTGKASLIYYRTQPDAAFPPAFCTKLVKSVFIDSITSNINYDIAASPITDKVAAVYLRPKSWKAQNFGDDDDIFYRVSTNLGDTWGDTIRITDFGDSEEGFENGGMYFAMRANEVSALYAGADDCLHVLYQAYWTDGIEHYYITKQCKVFHWSSCNPTCRVMLVDGTTWRSASACVMPVNAFVVHKINLTQCTVAGDKRLYAVYTMYPDSTAITGNTYSDCSNSLNGANTNGDIAVQGSIDLSGSLWGPMVNITNTRTNNCTVGLCASEQFTSAAPYVNDSLRIQYMMDLDAGSFVQNPLAPAAKTQGEETNNPIGVMSYQCYAIATEAVLAVSPTGIVWPFHTIPGGKNFVSPVWLTNTGNTPAAYTRSVAYVNGSNWLSFQTPASSTVPAGCTQTLRDSIVATGPGIEGLYKATITWSYTGSKTLELPVELYNYTAAHWFMEENNAIRTAHVSMTTNQTSRVGRMRAGGGFRYFPAVDTGYLYDGSLLIGKDSLSLSMGLFADTTPFGGVIGHGDTLLGRLFALTDMSFDSTGTPGPNTGWPENGYRHSWGSGCNKDSTIAFDCDFYAPKFVDSGNFMVGKFSLYKGTNDPTGTINNVLVCYTADFDIPDTAGASGENTGGADADFQMVYQQGKWAPNDTRFGALSGWLENGTPAAGGTVLMNRRSIHRLSGYVTDSAWTMIKGINSFTGTDSAGDMHSLLVLSKTATIKPKASGVFTVYVIFAGQPKVGGSLNGLKAAVCQGKAFIKNYLWPSMPASDPVLCPSCNSCGDANNDDEIDISDAVFLISYIFSGGPAPADCNGPNGKGDANGDGEIDISDAVYLISYIFSGGPAPHCP